MQRTIITWNWWTGLGILFDRVINDGLILCTDDGIIGGTLLCTTDDTKLGVNEGFIEGNTLETNNRLVQGMLLGVFVGFEDDNKLGTDDGLFDGKALRINDNRA